MLENKIAAGNQYTMEDVQISLLDLVLSISNALDHVAPELTNHHARVAYTAMSIAREMRMEQHELQSLLLASLLHDIGVLTSDERSQVSVFDSESIHRHAEAGYLLLKKYRLFDAVADIVRYPHASWSKCGSQCRCKGPAHGDVIPRASHILHLADRINVLIGSSSDATPRQVASIIDVISRESGSRFEPNAVAAFTRECTREQFWNELNCPQNVDVLR